LKYGNPDRCTYFRICRGKRRRNPLCFFTEDGRYRMKIVYNDKTDLLYIRFDDRKQDVINRRISEDIVLDMGENDRIVGIEIMDASRHIFLEKLLPVKYEVQKEKPLQG
jgi:uncharacterized protein YuzE